MGTPINKEIEITSLYFSGNKNNQRSLTGYPRRMTFEGREYNFVESGMQYLIQKGQELIRLFDVSDGQNDYRLRLDEGNHWTLVSMRTVA